MASAEEILNFIGTSFTKGYQSFSSAKGKVSTRAFFFVFSVLLFSANTYFNWNALCVFQSHFGISTFFFKPFTNFHPKTSSKQTQQYPLSCTNGSWTSTCPAQYPTTFDWDISSNISCPDYFRWIHEDLKPWKNNGITREVLERAKEISNFRLVILNGKAYIEQYKKSVQTRDVFTLWGILQLLRLYPGKVPDLELLFQCGDRTVVSKRKFGRQGVAPPPMFHYCGHEDFYDIVFPDWSFWGWIETNIRPWETTLRSTEEANKKIEWKDRIPYAFWKGNKYSCPLRQELMKCNSSGSPEYDWKAHLYALDWKKENKDFKNTKLEDQCTHRYKIYAEGNAWSVSEKYILACDSMTLIIKPNYYEFFSRSLVPLQHFWPIRSRSQNLCKDIKFAVEWGNNHTNKAQVIGKGGVSYLQQNLKMKFVYDYMFHLLQEYARLLRFKPTIPKGAIEICSDIMACPIGGQGKKFMDESMVMSPSYTPPCTMSSPFENEALKDFLKKKESLIKDVENISDEYWHNLHENKQLLREI